MPGRINNPEKPIRRSGDQEASETCHNVIRTLCRRRLRRRYEAATDELIDKGYLLPAFKETLMAIARGNQGSF
ncbi:MAG: hypothetical protein Q7U82_01190 [Gammaproteobacteria bacterium]|nr:hypothetical protein [Gammaproteobacteria bacterium]